MSRFSLLLAALALSTGCMEVYLSEVEPLDDSGEDWPSVDTHTEDGDSGVIDSGDTGETETDEPFEPEDDASADVFGTPGEHTYVVPSGVEWLRVQAWGGGGAGGNQQGATGGGGAWAAASIPVVAGETLTVLVAEGGVGQGDGGGASWLLRDTSVLLVAAGGGGGGSDGCSGCKAGGAGGAGGGFFGEDGQDLLVGFNGYCDAASGGRGASQSAGGDGGVPFGTAANQCTGEAGAESRGGMAKGVNGSCESGDGATSWQSGGGQGNGGGGAGGAGYFGGGGAGFIWTYCSGGGGGGSSFADSASVDVLLEGGTGQTEARFSTSGGAGAGGDVLGEGSAGQVRITPL